MAERTGGGLAHGDDRILLGDVHPLGQRVAAGLGDLADGLARGVVVAVGAYDLSPFPRQSLGGRTPYAGTSASDDPDLSVEQAHCVSSRTPRTRSACARHLARAPTG